MNKTHLSSCNRRLLIGGLATGIKNQSFRRVSQKTGCIKNKSLFNLSTQFLSTKSFSSNPPKSPIFAKNPLMRYILLLFALSLTALSAQQMLPSAEWCANSRKTAAQTPPPPPDTRSDSLDILHTDITLSLLTIPQLQATSVLTIAAKVNNVPGIRLDLEALTVDAVQANGSPATFSQSGNSLLITFPAPLSPGQLMTLSIDYQGLPKQDDSGWGGIYNQTPYHYNLGVGFAADPHSFGRAWFPCFDNFVERCSFEFHITSLAGRPAYCNGTLQSETAQNGQVTRHWKLDEPIPSYLACYATGPYVSWKRTINGIPVEIAAAAVDTNKVRVTFQHLPQALQCFQAWYGPYKWPKIGYSLVPFNAGAMEHATNIAIMRSAIDGTLNFETLWAHELSHHWWGDLATCTTAEDMWLNEGWAVYSEHLFTEFVYGKTAFQNAVRDNFLNVLQNAHVSEGGYRAVSGVPHSITYGDHVYKKGAVVAHNLRGYLGDTLFQKGIAVALANTNFDDWSSADFRDQLTAATGYDMTSFFEDWVFSPGFTHFSVDSTQIVPTGGEFVVKVFVKQKLRGAPQFYQQVPLEFTFVNAAHQRLNQTATVSGEQSMVTFMLPFLPEFVWLNTNLHLTLARSDKEVVLKNSLTQNLTFAKISITATTLPDSALVRAEYHFVRPDTAGCNPQGYKITDRYWTIEGDFPAGFAGNAGIFYDGRGQLDQLDAELFAQNGPSEDDIRLLYRTKPGQPWQEYPTYFKNKLASPTDKHGFIRIDHVQPGQYTLGKGSSVATHEAGRQLLMATATPNPARSEIRLRAEGKFDKVLLVNADGGSVRDWKLPLGQQADLQVESVPAGQYWLLLFGPTGTGAVSIFLTGQ